MYLKFRNPKPKCYSSKKSWIYTCLGFDWFFSSGIIRLLNNFVVTRVILFVFQYICQGVTPSPHNMKLIDSDLLLVNNQWS